MTMRASNPYRYVRALRPHLWLSLVIYFAFSVGIVKATHLCADREASVAWFTEPDRCACADSQREPDPCCEDTQELIRVDDVQKNVTTFTCTSPDYNVIAVLYGEPNFAVAGGPAIVPEVSPHPPRPLYTIHCSFVFYDLPGLG